MAVVGTFLYPGLFPIHYRTVARHRFMSLGATWLSLDTIQALKEFWHVLFCFVLPRTFSAFCRVAFIMTSISKLIKLIAMKTLRNKISIIYLTPAQTYRNITSIPIHNVWANFWWTFDSNFFVLNIASVVFCVPALDNL